MSREPELTARRLAALRAGLGPDCAALLVDLIDVQWLTGLESSNAAALISADRAVLLTDFRYRSAASEMTGAGAGIELVIAADLVRDAAGLAAEWGVAKLLTERDRITLAQDALLADVLGERVQRIASGRLAEPARAVKTPEEIERIAAAQQLADDAFREVVLERGIAGRTEREVALDLEIAMRRRGAEGVSFAPIIAAGPHGALPHAHPRDVEIPEHELVVIDWGCTLDSYCSDSTRTVATGSVDEPRVRVHQIVREAQDAAIAAIRPGATGVDVDKQARDLIGAAGHADHFGHGLGHGVGLEVHEAPNLSPRSQATLEAGHVVTVEPGIYLPGEFGVRIEELVAVTADGPQILTGLPRGLDVG